jgi:hypothetical protein
MIMLQYIPHISGDIACHNIDILDVEKPLAFPGAPSCAEYYNINGCLKMVQYIPHISPDIASHEVNIFNVQRPLALPFDPSYVAYWNITPP